MANTYDIGDRVRIQGTFTDSAGTAIDPTTVSVKYQCPSGTVTTHIYGTDPEVIKSAIGVYYEDINADESGEWPYRWYGTDGTNYQGAGETMFLVRLSELA